MTNLQSIATSGVAARLAGVERAVHKPVGDPGQRQKVGPSVGSDDRRFNRLVVSSPLYLAE